MKLKWNSIRKISFFQNTCMLAVKRFKHQNICLSLLSSYRYFFLSGKQWILYTY